jgi:hypothetical protein
MLDKGVRVLLGKVEQAGMFRPGSAQARHYDVDERATPATAAGAERRRPGV